MRTLIYGACMGTCDAVPGVSGGTIALILGFYDQLITAIAKVLAVIKQPFDKTAWSGALQALWFLIPLGIGLVSALLLAVKLLVGDKPDPSLVPTAAATDAATLASQQAVINDWLATCNALLLNPSSAPIVFAFFFGLVIASIAEPWRRRTSRAKIDWGLAVAGAILAAFIALAPPLAASDHPLVWICSGALAISVMLLPGISGSLALLLIGMYQPIASAASHSASYLLSFIRSSATSSGSFDDVVALAMVLSGMVIGLLIFIPCLKSLLKRQHDRTMAFLSGLMSGSLVALWPWKSHYFAKANHILGPAELNTPSGAWWWAILAAVSGAVIIVGASRLSQSGTTNETATAH